LTQEAPLIATEYHDPTAWKALAACIAATRRSGMS
jgi:hypothetical protein